MQALVTVQTNRLGSTLGWASVLSGAFLIGAVGVAGAATPVYVDGAGVCGGRSPCFTTIQLGVNNAGPPPAVVNVFPGTYAESVDIGLMGSAIAGSAGDLTLQTVNAAGVPTPGTASVLPAGGPALRSSVTPFPGNITIDGFIVQSPDDTGIILGQVMGALTLVGVVSDGNATAGLSVGVVAGEVAIRDASFSNNLGGSGIKFQGASDVTFEAVTADGNKGNGASFTMSGALRIMRSSFSQNTNGNGLDFGVATDVTFDEVTADGNQNTAASFGVSGVLRISNSSFSNTKNGGGLDFGTPSDVTFDRVVANGNQNSGASFAVSGTLRISDSSFSNAKNGGGLSFGTPSDVTFKKVVANGNQNTGASFAVSGALWISDSSFSNTKNGAGLSFGTPRDVTFDKVAADGNQDAGASFALTGTLRAFNSSFSKTKNGDGLMFSNPTDTTFAGVVANGNSENGVDSAMGQRHITGSRFEQNGRNGIIVSIAPPDAAFRLSCNDIDGNKTGLRLVSASIIDAPQNFWGAASGPTHPTNPGGTGDLIADGANGGAGTVIFRPFLTVPSAESALCAGRGAPALDTPALALLLLALLVLPGWRLARRV